ncbi:MAG: menaquinone biosynthesis protein [Gemmatimonadota bacterium]|nr:menaquinone biosynthesis protein [Gemmatimonadota bacterium]
MRVGRIPYINTYPVYGAIDRGIVPLPGTLVDGIPSQLNRMMSRGQLDVSVVSAVEYARESERYLLLPDLGITSDGPVRSVMLFSKRPAEELGGRRVLLTRSSMTSVALLGLLFEHVWKVTPALAAGDAELADVRRFAVEEHDARLVIGDAALHLGARVHARAAPSDEPVPSYPYVYDLGEEWKRWTGLPFVFAVWIAQRATPVVEALEVHARLIQSRDWGVAHVDELATQAARATGVARSICANYFAGLDYRLTLSHLAGLTSFFARLAESGQLPNCSLAFLPAA